MFLSKALFWVGSNANQQFFKDGLLLQKIHGIINGNMYNILDDNCFILFSRSMNYILSKTNKLVKISPMSVFSIGIILNFQSLVDYFKNIYNR